MRIIAGSARGRTIAAPKGQNTRPTQDYVRESLFNILQQEVPGAKVLDLYAGSGALALEALSRGADESTLVDCAPEAIACIEKNVEALRFGEQASVLRSDGQLALKRLSRENKRFSIVFLDPPYRVTDVGAQCASMADLQLLEPDALLVIEHRKGTDPILDGRFTLRDARGYGDTVIHFFTYREEGEPDA